MCPSVNLELFRAPKMVLNQSQSSCLAPPIGPPSLASSCTRKLSRQNIAQGGVLELTCRSRENIVEGRREGLSALILVLATWSVFDRGGSGEQG